MGDNTNGQNQTTDSQQTQVNVGQLVLFNKYFIDENITYKNGKFTFNKHGLYSINFSIYIESMQMPSADVNVEYGDNEQFIVSAKGINDITTAHSMVIPCSFTNKFYKDDYLQLRNISSGDIILMSNFNESIGSIISINLIH